MWEPNRNCVLADNRGQMENRFAEISVSFHLHLLSSCLSIDAFCENPPRQFLWDGHACSRVWAGATRKIPTGRSLGQKPLAAAITRNLEENHRSKRRIHVPV